MLSKSEAATAGSAAQTANTREAVKQECLDIITAAQAIATARNKPTFRVVFAFDAGPGMNDALEVAVSKGYTFAPAAGGLVTEDDSSRVYILS